MNGSIEKPPRATSSAPSSDMSALSAAAVDADKRPIRLLAREAARIAAARRVLRQGLEECVGRGAVSQVLDDKLGEGVAGSGASRRSILMKRASCSGRSNASLAPSPSSPAAARCQATPSSEASTS